MKKLHVECLPDETLAVALGVSKKSIIHHQGKSRVFASLIKKSNQLAIVDEDPKSVKSSFEKQLKFVEEKHGIKIYSDKNDNKILMLKEKLEDWILGSINQKGKIIKTYGLPENANQLHREINYKIPAFKKLLNSEINDNQSLIYLQKLLNS
jgi:hypothetical protein